MKVISSTDNQLIKLAHKLKQRKYRESEGLFLVEGIRSVEELAAYPDHIVALFIDPAVTDPKLQLRASADLVFQVDSKLMQHICTTETSQGVAAIARKPSWRLEEMLRKDGLLVLLDRVSDPGNLGGILRTCWALSVDGVLLTRGCVDPFSPKVVRSTMGGIFNVPLLEDVSEQKWRQVREAGYSFVGTGGNAKSEYFNADLTGACVLVMGSEADGLEDKVGEQCDELVKIPMRPNVDSLNVAAACAILVAEAQRQRRGL